MVRAQFHQTNDQLPLKREGRLVSAWAVQVKSLVSGRFVPNGLLVHLSDVKYVDPVGEQLLPWLSDSQPRETCHARDICERLHLTLKGDADGRVPSATAVHPLPTAAPNPRPGELP